MGLLALALTLVSAIAGLAQGPFPAEATPAPSPPSGTDFQSQLEPLREAVVSLSVAAALATILAFRPRRRASSERDVSVPQTQIILAVVGAMIMVVVGASVARAFGIVGAASLVRYRAKVNDPKDAVVMLSTLGIGFAAGVGLYLFAAFATAFILLVLWALESREPEEYKRFEVKLKVKGKDVDPLALRPRIEEVLRRNRIAFELRTNAADELSYDVRVPPRKTTDRLSNQLLALEKNGSLEVEWDEKKKDKK